MGTALKRENGMISQRSAFWAAAWLLGVGTAAAAGAAPPVSALKSQSVVEVEARAKLAQEINDSLFSFSELAFQEFETAKYLTGILESEGFSIQRDVAGLPSGWVASWANGTGGPVIALGSDIDGIPKANQKPGIPWREPLVAGAPGHGEGHNSGQAVNIVAALAVRDLMKLHNIAGTLVLWPGVAEELVAGKAFMVREGVFEGVDAVVFTHVGNNLETAWGQPMGTGLVSVEYTFNGESAHAAGSPWRGRSALDAVELMNMGWNMRREHLRPEQRSHYVISDGGDQPNVVPSVASVWYFFREQGFTEIQNSFDIGNVISEAAAQMTGTTVTRRIIGTAAPRHFNRPIAEAAYANIKMVGLPKWTADEQAFAKLVQKNAQAPKQDGLAVELKKLEPPLAEPKSGGSDDIGDVSWTVPTITIRYPSNIPDLPGHNWTDAIAMATPIAHKGVVSGAKVVAMTTLDILTDAKLRQAARDYFTNIQTKTQKYVPMIGADDKPAIEINADIMARYKPELSKHYYDPARYPTYLDQLGIQFPMLEKPMEDRGGK
jgi:aminobenzoyl-glutamate utilization protein B